MGTESEKFRFEETNRLIRTHIGPVNTMLEIGCGEGHQTSRLADLGSKLFAIDISGRAIERAKRRCPKAMFGVGDVFSAPILGSVPRFDLVVACEVLYYMRDVPAVLARMEQLGRSCFVTYVDAQRLELASVLDQMPRRQTAEFGHNQIIWHAVWWSVDSGTQAG